MCVCVYFCFRVLSTYKHTTSFYHHSPTSSHPPRPSSLPVNRPYDFRLGQQQNMRHRSPEACQQHQTQPTSVEVIVTGMGMVVGDGGSGESPPSAAAAGAVVAGLVGKRPPYRTVSTADEIEC